MNAPAAPPRRRGPSKGDLKEQAILDACEELLARKPLREIEVAELARGAGISRPTFYFYFESKDAALRALVERIADEMQDKSERWLEGAADEPRVAARRSIEAAVQLWRDHGPVLRAAVESLGSVGDFWEGIVRRFVEQSAERIAADRDAGMAPPGPDPEALAKALVWMNERCFYTYSVGAGLSLSDDEIVDTLTEIWMRAVYGVTPPGA
jgi:AcrR family transcriptional regulator